MFTGIITGVGRVLRHEPLGLDTEGIRLIVDTADWPIDDIGIGDSIAHNGCCLTIVDKGKRWLASDVSAHTLGLVTGLEPGRLVNLEKSLRLADRLGGHLVSGHVDTQGRLRIWERRGESWHMQIEVDGAWARYLAVKGSVAVHGVSLTINQVEDGEGLCRFAINIIPHTWAMTAFRELRAGDAVNIEIDTVARYVERMLGRMDRSEAGPGGHS